MSTARLLGYDPGSARARLERDVVDREHARVLRIALRVSRRGVPTVPVSFDELPEFVRVRALAKKGITDRD